MKAKHVIIGMVAAAAVGALIGTLFAPEKGADTRKKLVDGANDLASKVKKGLRRNHVTDDIEVGS